MADGFKLYAYSNHPKGNPIGHIHILHGMAEHSGRYDFAMKFSVNKVLSFQDMITAGMDKRQPKWCERAFCRKDGFNRVVEDAHEVISYMKKSSSSVKIHPFRA